LVKSIANLILKYIFQNDSTNTAMIQPSENIWYSKYSNYSTIHFISNRIIRISRSNCSNIYIFKYSNVPEFQIYFTALLRTFSLHLSVTTFSCMHLIYNAINVVLILLIETFITSSLINNLL